MINKKLFLIGMAVFLLLFNFGFTGCESDAANEEPPPQDITEEPEEPPPETLATRLAWIKANAEDDGEYTIQLEEDESSGPMVLDAAAVNSKTGVTIILKGGDGDEETDEKTVTLTGKGSLFTIQHDSADGGEPEISLVLGKNITLKGVAENSDSLVKVKAGGKLKMEDGSKVTGNAIASYRTSVHGGGIYVDSGGTLTLAGGAISGNTAPNRGGGVYINNGSFTMTGGEISGNTAGSFVTGIGSGGGIFIVHNGTLALEGGKISGNTTGSGGGVYLSSGTVTIAAGVEISGNSGGKGGGGVYIKRDTVLTMTGGEISGNMIGKSSGTHGGGVYVDSGATFTMTGGEISGHLIAVSTNYHNTAGQNGGGVYVSSLGTFNKTGGGAIYGFSLDDPANPKRNEIRGPNRVVHGMGYAVYGGSINRIRETTAGPDVDLDWTQTSPNGGWQVYTVINPPFSSQTGEAGGWE